MAELYGVITDLGFDDTLESLRKLLTWCFHGCGKLLFVDKVGFHGMSCSE